MKSFKNYLTEARKLPGEDVLDKAPVQKAEHRFLPPYATKDYTDDPSEVKISDLGLKMLHKDHISQKLGHSNKNPHKYHQYGIQHIDLSKVHFTQPVVNREKVRKLMHEYRDNPEHWHTTKELKKWEGPTVHKYPDGTYVSSDHHRLVAAALRGDTHTYARVHEYGHDGKGGLTITKAANEWKPAKPPKAPKK